jgi:hypothetical protein
LIHFGRLFDLLLGSSTIIVRRVVSISIRAWNFRDRDLLLGESLNNFRDHSIDNVDKLVTDNKIPHHIEKETETVI